MLFRSPSPRKVQVLLRCLRGRARERVGPAIPRGDPWTWVGAQDQTGGLRPGGVSTRSSCRLRCSVERVLDASRLEAVPRTEKGGHDGPWVQAVLAGGGVQGRLEIQPGHTPVPGLEERPSVPWGATPQLWGRGQDLGTGRPLGGRSVCGVPSAQAAGSAERGPRAVDQPHGSLGALPLLDRKSVV